MPALALLPRTTTDPEPDVSGTYVGPSCPRLVVEIDFATDPTEQTRTWTDVTGDVRAISYQRAGRQHELQRTEAGTLQMTLDNRAGDYDPTNENGTHYPNVKKTRWVRVRGVWNEIVYPRWQGLIESYAVQWPSGGLDATVTVTAVDTFKILNLFDLTGETFAEQTTGERVVAVALAAGIEVSSVSDGASTVVAADFTSSGSAALAHLQQIEETENGLLYIDGKGQLVFEDRTFRPLLRQTSSGTLGDDTGEIPYRPVVAMSDDDSNIWNAASVTPDGGEAATAEDAASVASHYRRTISRTILSADANEAQAAAEYLLGIYADPRPRIPALDILAMRDSGTHWPTVLAAGNSTRLLWKRRPYNELVARTISLPVYLERVSETIIPGTAWNTRFELSPADDRQYWILGEAGYSELGETTVLTY